VVSGDEIESSENSFQEIHFAEKIHFIWFVVMKTKVGKIPFKRFISTEKNSNRQTANRALAASVREADNLMTKVVSTYRGCIATIDRELYTIC
jgi:hypothetical protein